jgi:hypothetical protein
MTITTTCSTCQNALGLLAEIAVAIRQLPPEKQAEFRAYVLRRNLPAPPSSN